MNPQPYDSTQSDASKETRTHSLFRRILIALGYLWASPNTLMALAIGLILGGRFQVVDGVVEIEGKTIASILSRLPNPAAAMTIGHVVLGQNTNLLNLTRRHERVHVRQYARVGTVFLACLSRGLELPLRDRSRRLPTKPVRNRSVRSRQSLYSDKPIRLDNMSLASSCRLLT